MRIDLEGRQRVDLRVEELSSSKIVTVSEYDDGTVLEIIVTSDRIDIQCSKTLVTQPDGVTVKIHN